MPLDLLSSAEIVPFQRVKKILYFSLNLTCNNFFLHLKIPTLLLWVCSVPLFPVKFLLLPLRRAVKIRCQTACTNLESDENIISLDV